MDVRSELKPPVEVRYREELEALRALDTDRKPLNWKMSPKAVRTFILGSREPLSWNGKEISIRKKYPRKYPSVLPRQIVFTTMSNSISSTCRAISISKAK